MPLLIIILLGAIALWFLLSVFFEKIGGVMINLIKKFNGALNDSNKGEKTNE